jgi:hypothetical protein
VCAYDCRPANPVAVAPRRRARWPGHKPICMYRVDRAGPDPGIACMLHAAGSAKITAVRCEGTFSRESAAECCRVAYSRDFGLRPGQAVNRVPAGYCTGTHRKMRLAWTCNSEEKGGSSMGNMGLGSVGRAPPIAFPCRIPHRGLCFLYVRFHYYYHIIRVGAPAEEPHGHK